MQSVNRSSTIATTLVALCLAVVGHAGPASETHAATANASRDDWVRAAITEAVQARMGDDADVTVAAMEIVGEASSALLQAVPEPNARLGDWMHLRLLGTDGRGQAAHVVGGVSAFVSVAVDHVRVRTLVPRGRELAEGDVAASHDVLDGVPLRRLPRLREVAGTRALVNLAPGDVIARTSVALRPAVKSGQLVRATARVGGVVVTAALVAVQDGAPGAVIRVVNKDSRRELRARVVEPGVVEVIQ